MESRNTASVAHFFTPRNMREVTAAPEKYLGWNSIQFFTQFAKWTPSGKSVDQNPARGHFGTIRTPEAPNESVSLRMTFAAKGTGGDSHK